MGLEDRVLTLEHEVKILKNEIQNTLLEIQGQILLRYYPSLRAENSSPSKDTLAALAALETRSVGQTNGAHKRRGDATEKSTRTSEELTTPLRAREISLHEIEDNGKQWASASMSEPPSTAGRESDGKGSGILFTALIEWTIHSVEQIGSERTCRLLEIYAREGYLAAKTRKALVQLVTLDAEPDSTRKVNVKAMLDACLRLDAVLDRETDITEALAFSEEANRGEDDRHNLHDHR